ncbi:Fur family transcriptional regulator [Singulisphaera sp. PoT]|uniref:Fur family transcriptional regulator n=1 Tax=Singulisphaera sp. PoT TaxID=3411797 RepID=UPI003BF4A96F
MSSDFHHEDVRQALEAGGWRCTPQRLAVYQYLSQTDDHPTAEEVFQGVRFDVPRISLATIYKALEALVECGIATKLTEGDGSARYDARSEQHYHLRCLKSGRVRDLPTTFDPGLIDRLDPKLTSELRDQGFHVTGYRLELVGFFDQEDASMSGAEGSAER